MGIEFRSSFVGYIFVLNLVVSSVRFWQRRLGKYGFGFVVFAFPRLVFVAR